MCSVCVAQNKLGTNGNASFFFFRLGNTDFVANTYFSGDGRRNSLIVEKVSRSREQFLPPQLKLYETATDFVSPARNYAFPPVPELVGVTGVIWASTIIL